MKKLLVLVLVVVPCILSAQTTGTLTDTRDGKVYPTVIIGNQRWMAGNLNYGTIINGSANQTANGLVEKYCYNNLETNCDTLGALYQWDEMMNYSADAMHHGICPEGWHVPTDDEWKELEIKLGMSASDANLTGFRGTDQGTKLKAGGSSGFNAELDGYMTTPNSFIRYGTGNSFWTSTDLFARFLLNTSLQVYRWDNPMKSYGLSLRCVMDYPFAQSGITLPQMQGSVVSWGDYDSDGDMDLYLSGMTTYPDGICDIFRNNGNSTFTALGESFNRISGSADWGDYDCDGDADLLVSGYSWSLKEYVTLLYRNDGAGVFTNYPIGLPGATFVRWGDYDNDGDPDILLGQLDGTIEIYENKGTGTYQRSNIYFEKSAAAFVPLTQVSFEWGDYNNDGYQDIVVEGKDDINNEYCKIYKNNGDKTFTDLRLMLRGASNGRIRWGDFDNDNDLDILMTGYSDKVRVYRNDGNDTFTNLPAELTDGQHYSSWIDFNNDGNLDILIQGLTASKIFAGDGKGSFEYKPCNIAKAYPGDLDIADFDNDNDLDFALSGYISGSYTMLYRNITQVVNHAPQVPTGLTARQNGADVIFTWNAASDYENGENLSYNITVGTGTNNCLIVSPMSKLTNGKRLRNNWGNVGYDTTWILRNAPLGTLYWSVQSIDKSMKSSPFASFKSLEVKPPFTSIYIGDVLSDKTITGSKFIDINNDGLLDILVSCSYTLGKIPSKEVYCFINNGDNTFYQGSILGSKLVGELLPCNLNGDSHMDALLYGEDYIEEGVIYKRVLRIYELINNNSGGFNVSTDAFTGNYTSAPMTLGDYDNDGDEDIFIIGYKNDTVGTFLFAKESSGYSISDIGLRFDITDEAIYTCDVDNDLDLDIAYGPYILINNGNFVKTDIFPYKSIYAMDWGDYDGDGDLDAAIGGTDTIDNYSTTIFRNDGNLNFTPLRINIKTFANKFFLRWLDFNNDGLPDLVTSGIRDIYHTYIYLNQGNDSFKETDYSGYDASDLGDFDNDGDLDILGDYFVYISNGDWSNRSPKPPQNLTYLLDQFDVVLAWNKADDDKGSNGLSYNVKIGTGEGSYDIMPVLTSTEGQLRVPRPGNVQTNTGWRLKNFPLGDYYWSVQAVDQALIGGSWTSEQKFTVSYVSANFSFDTVCEGIMTTFKDMSVASEGRVTSWKWDFGDGHTASVKNPRHLFDHGGHFVVSLTAFAGSYQHTKKQIVFVKPKPHPDFSAATVCHGSKTSFQDFSGIDSITIEGWQWDFGDGDVSDIQGSVQHSYIKPGTYSAQLMISADNGCADALIRQVTVGKIPDSTIMQVDKNESVKLCIGDSISLSVEDDPYYHYQWIKDNVFLQKDTFSNVVITNGGNYRVHIVNRLGNCTSSSETVSVGILDTPPQASIEAGSSTYICQGNSVHVEVPYVADYYYQWECNDSSILGATSNWLDAIKEGYYSVLISNGACATRSKPIQITYKPGVSKPVLYAYGPDYWFFICNIHHARVYKWYYNGNLVAENDKNQFYAGTNFGAYYVEVNDGGECFVPSDEVTIPLIPDMIKPVDDGNDFYLYPNPAEGQIFVVYTSPITGHYIIRIYDMEGEVIKVQESSSYQGYFSQEIDISDLEPGLYLMELYTDQILRRIKFFIFK
jgi:uncharacterized protein (TIGR02145 family)